MATDKKASNQSDSLSYEQFYRNGVAVGISTARHHTIIKLQKKLGSTIDVKFIRNYDIAMRAFMKKANREQTIRYNELMAEFSETPKQVVKKSNKK